MTKCEDCKFWKQECEGCRIRRLETEREIAFERHLSKTDKRYTRFNPTCVKCGQTKATQLTNYGEKICRNCARKMLHEQFKSPSKVPQDWYSMIVKKKKGWLGKLQ